VANSIQFTGLCLTMSCVRTWRKQQAASDLTAWVNFRGRDVLNFYDDYEVHGPQNMPIGNEQKGDISSVTVSGSVKQIVGGNVRNSGVRPVN
jgi:hypothetical protein